MELIVEVKKWPEGNDFDHSTTVVALPVRLSKWRLETKS